MLRNLNKIIEKILKKTLQLFSKTALKTGIFLGLTAYWCIIIVGTFMEIY